MTNRSYRRYRRDQARIQRRASDSCALVIACWLGVALALAAAGMHLHL